MGFETKEIEEILYGLEDKIKSGRYLVADYHVNQMDNYFEDAEKRLNIFWDSTSPFYKYFVELDLSNVVELACGRGRHVQKYIDLAGKITLIDILDSNIEYCKDRFMQEGKISYYVNNGFDLSALPSEAYTSIFSYDSMVHFELFDIFSYLKETNRILKKGGYALYHHSNNTERYDINFLTGTSGRNYMSKDIFAYLANRAGLTVVNQELYDWRGDDTYIDCITLLRK